MSEQFDLVVIGSGSAAGEIAATVRKAGKSVALIDSRPFGGTCALRGCDPKKVLVGAADLVDWNRRMKPHGVVGDSRIAWPELMRFKRTFTEPVPPAREKSYAEQGIDAIHGRAHFLGPDRLQVNDRELIATNFAIAAGLVPAPLTFPGAERLIDSTQFLELDSLPKRITFIGGGYIAFEFAHLAVRAGSEVTILAGGKPLAGFDSDLVGHLLKHSREIGIRVVVGDKVTSIDPATADLFVHAAGRVPDIADMGLDAANVAHNAKGIAVGKFLQSTTNTRVYAAGDCAATGNPALTPVAGFEGRIAAANILKPESLPLTPHIIPSVVFTIPPLTRVGLTEAEARQKSLQYECIMAETGGWYSSRRVGEHTGFSKVLVEKGTGKILGAHVLGHMAEELINVFALSIRCGLSAEDLKDQIFSYPSHGSDIRYMV